MNFDYNNNSSSIKDSLSSSAQKTPISNNGLEDNHQYTPRIIASHQNFDEKYKTLVSRLQSLEYILANRYNAHKNFIEQRHQVLFNNTIKDEPPFINLGDALSRLFDISAVNYNAKATFVQNPSKSKTASDDRDTNDINVVDENVKEKKPLEQDINIMNTQQFNMEVAAMDSRHYMEDIPRIWQSTLLGYKLRVLRDCEADINQLQRALTAVRARTSSLMTAANPEKCLVFPSSASNIVSKREGPNNIPINTTALADTTERMSTPSKIINKPGANMMMMAAPPSTFSSLKPIISSPSKCSLGASSLPFNYNNNKSNIIDLSKSACSRSDQISNTDAYSESKCGATWNTCSTVSGTTNSNAIQNNINHNSTSSISDTFIDSNSQHQQQQQHILNSFYLHSSQQPQQQSIPSSSSSSHINLEPHFHAKHDNHQFKPNNRIEHFQNQHMLQLQQLQRIQQHHHRQEQPPQQSPMLAYMSLQQQQQQQQTNCQHQNQLSPVLLSQFQQQFQQQEMQRAYSTPMTHKPC